VLQALYRTHILDRNSLANIFNINNPMEVQKKIIKILREANCVIDKGNNKYIKTRAFMNWLRQRRKEINGTRYEQNWYSSVPQYPKGF